MEILEMMLLKRYWLLPIYRCTLFIAGSCTSGKAWRAVEWGGSVL